MIGTLAKKLKEQEREIRRMQQKEKEKKHVFKKNGCEKQFLFNEEVRELLAEEMRTGLERYFENEVPEALEDIIKRGEDLIGERNHSIKIADELGWEAAEAFEKDDLARNDTEEKKLAKLRKEKKERGQGRFRQKFRSGFVRKGSERSDRGINRYTIYRSRVSYRHETSSTRRSAGPSSSGDRRRSAATAKGLVTSQGTAESQRGTKEGRGRRN